ncbi:MAG: DinB family protein [Chloroflexi bacterium]|nr:DinB family protein [Chloroflexota bacterium]
MDLSRWFSDQLQGSRDVVLWAIEQLPLERVDEPPPPWLGEWSAAHHLAHLVRYEQKVVVPSMRQWLGGGMPDVGEGGDDAAISDVVHLQAEFRAVRTDQLALLPEFGGALWKERRRTVWGDVPLRWVVGKTLQHTYDHGNTILRMTLFPRPLPPDPTK